MVASVKRYLLLLMLVLPISAFSYTRMHDGNDLKKWIESYQKSKNGSATHTDTMNVGALFGYISGVSDSSKDICLPEGKDFGDITYDVIGYVNAHPEVKDISASLIINLALTKYACAGK